MKDLNQLVIVCFFNLQFDFLAERCSPGGILVAVFKCDSVLRPATLGLARNQKILNCKFTKTHKPPNLNIKNPNKDEILFFFNHFLLFFQVLSEEET